MVSVKNIAYYLPFFEIILVSNVILIQIPILILILTLILILILTPPHSYGVLPGWRDWGVNQLRMGSPAPAEGLTQVIFIVNI